MKLLDLNQLFKENVCSLEMSKTIKESGSGITLTSCEYAYDKCGDIVESKAAEVFEFGEFYPCINLAFAILMLDDRKVFKFDDLNIIEIIQFDNPDKEKGGNIYIFKYDGQEIAREENLVDLLLRAWLKFKR